MKYVCKRAKRQPSGGGEHRWVILQARVEQLLKVAEANLQANCELRRHQEEQQRYLEAERRQSEALRNSTADLRTSVMELREGQALWQSQLDELRSCLRDLLKEHSQLLQIIAQQQQALRESQEIIRALLERMNADHSDFRYAIRALLQQLHETLQYLVLEAGGKVAQPVRHPEAGENSPAESL